MFLNLSPKKQKYFEEIIKENFVTLMTLEKTFFNLEG